MNFFNKSATSFLILGIALCSQAAAAPQKNTKANEPVCSDKQGVVERVNDQISDTFSAENRARIAKKLKDKLNKKGQKAKLIKQVRKTEEEIVDLMLEADEAIVKGIKNGKIIDKADDKIAKLTSEESRQKVMQALKDAFDSEKEAQIRDDINNSNLTDKQKAAMMELIDLLHCETSKIPVESK